MLSPVACVPSPPSQPISVARAAMPRGPGTLASILSPLFCLMESPHLWASPQPPLFPPLKTYSQPLLPSTPCSLLCPLHGQTCIRPLLPIFSHFLLRLSQPAFHETALGKWPESCTQGGGRGQVQRPHLRWPPRRHNSVAHPSFPLQPHPSPGFPPTSMALFFILPHCSSPEPAPLLHPAPLASLLSLPRDLTHMWLTPTFTPPAPTLCLSS